MKYSIIKDNEVVNVIEWDGVSDWTPPEGCTLQKCGEVKGTERIGNKKIPFGKEFVAVDTKEEVK